MKFCMQLPNNIPQDAFPRNSGKKDFLGLFLWFMNPRVLNRFWTHMRVRVFALTSTVKKIFASGYSILTCKGQRKSGLVPTADLQAPPSPITHSEVAIFA